MSHLKDFIVTKQEEEKKERRDNTSFSIFLCEGITIILIVLLMEDTWRQKLQITRIRLLFTTWVRSRKKKLGVNSHMFVII